MAKDKIVIIFVSHHMVFKALGRDSLKQFNRRDIFSFFVFKALLQHTYYQNTRDLNSTLNSIAKVTIFLFHNKETNIFQVNLII